MLSINKSLVDHLGFDLSVAVSDFQQAVADHAFTVGIPAPTAPDIVEAIVRQHGGQFVVIDDTAPDAPPDSLVRVTTNQARLALLAAGKLDQVDAYVATLGAAANTRWHYAAHIYRDSPLIAQAVADSLLTEAEVDALFAAAARIE